MQKKFVFIICKTKIMKLLLFSLIQNGYLKLTN